MGVHRDFYRADSDTNVWVGYFLNIDPPRKTTFSQRVSQIRVQKKHFITLFYIHISYWIYN